MLPIVLTAAVVACEASAATLDVRSGCGAAVPVSVYGESYSTPLVTQQVWMNQPWQTTVNPCPSRIGVDVSKSASASSVRFFYPSVCKTMLVTIKDGSPDCSVEFSEK